MALFWSLSLVYASFFSSCSPACFVILSYSDLFYFGTNTPFFVHMHVKFTRAHMPPAQYTAQGVAVNPIMDFFTFSKNNKTYIFCATRFHNSAPHSKGFKVTKFHVYFCIV